MRRALCAVTALLLAALLQSCSWDDMDITVTLYNDCAWYLNITIKNLDDPEAETQRFTLNKKAQKVRLSPDTNYRLCMRGPYDYYYESYIDLTTRDAFWEKHTWRIEYSTYSAGYVLHRQ